MEENNERKTLYEKFTIGERLKYMAVPLALSATAALGPEIKTYYRNLSEEEKADYSRYAKSLLGGIGAAGAIYIFSKSKTNKQ